MRCAIIAVAVLLAGAAEAKENCVAMKVLTKGLKVTKLTPGQANFAAGGFTATPPISAPPAHDGAALVEADGMSVVVWTRGPLACGEFLVSPAFLAALLGAKTAKDEEGI